MTSAGSAVPTADAAAYRAVEHIYHSYLTGLILMLASRAGTPRAAEVVFRTFRRQQLARFLPGLQKLGLDRLPHAVAFAALASPGAMEKPSAPSARHAL